MRRATTRKGPRSASSGALVALLRETPEDSPSLVYAWKPDAPAVWIQTLRASVEAAGAATGRAVEIAICPHPGGRPTCWCRPPLPAMVLAFAHHHRIDLRISKLVGASAADRAMARALGMIWSQGATPMNPGDCLPAALRGPGTRITPLAPRDSGSQVFLVEAGEQRLVLKVVSTDEPLELWRRKRELQRLAAEAALAPQIVHVDESRRAVLSVRVIDHDFPARYVNPQTRGAMVELLGRTLKQVHHLPMPPNAEPAQPRASLAKIAPVVSAFAPAFAADAIQRVLGEDPPPEQRPLVLSHNDVNPGNLVDDGERLLLVDWETVAPNDPFYDLAAIATFLRMDDESALTLLSAYDGTAVLQLPPRFTQLRRLVAALCGATFLQIARARGHAGPSDETLESALSLGDFYGKLREGALQLGTPDGQWAFGLALLKESIGL